MHNRNLPAAGEGGRVYRVLKARAIACKFGPGRPIRLGPLANQLGVSTTPVRAALNMLAAEGLVEREPQKGFVAVTLSEERLAGLYRLNRVLLDAALTEYRPVVATIVAAFSTAADIGKELACSESHTPGAMADCAGRLFTCFARLSNNSHITEAVEQINDNLHYVRALEYEHLDDVTAELVTLCRLFRAGRLDDVAQAIAVYHDERLRLLPVIVAALPD